ncbi:hypothetical protein BW686_15865 [Pseudomonas syringae]|uniref:Uncharacterized protein n=1 Tax=Pseudomonas syringae TaxID=317 RepID=A0A244EQ32_PSESX|nr:hypothetical protein BW686_15865 [Pseudomonas syringae]
MVNYLMKKEGADRSFGNLLAVRDHLVACSFSVGRYFWLFLTGCDGHFADLPVIERKLLE